MTTSACTKAELPRFPSAVAVAVLSTATLAAFAQPAVGQGTATASELQFAALRDRMVPHLSNPPEQGVNTVLVGHDDPFDAATGIYPEPMGVTFVVRPSDRDSFEILGNIAPDAWPESAN